MTNVASRHSGYLQDCFRLTCSRLAIKDGCDTFGEAVCLKTFLKFDEGAVVEAFFENVYVLLQFVSIKHRFFLYAAA